MNNATCAGCQTVIGCQKIDEHCPNLLAQCIASGQASAEQIEAHRAAGDVSSAAVQPPTAQPASVNMPITPSERMCEIINGGYDNLSVFDKRRLMSRAQLLYASLLKFAQPVQPAAMSDADLSDDDALRFAQRVLASPGTEEDRKTARDGLWAVRKRVRKATIALPVEAAIAAHDKQSSDLKAELHQYQEIAEHYAKCEISPEALRDWVSERMNQPAQPLTAQPVHPPESDDLTASYMVGLANGKRIAQPQQSAAMPKFRCFSFDGIDRVEPIDDGEYVLYDDVAAAWPKGTS